MTTLEGLDTLLPILQQLTDPNAFAPALLAGGEHLKGAIALYPPATAANQPRTFVSKAVNTWYERGYGPKWARKDGSIGGSKTSETLGRSWAVTAESPLRVIVGNDATYGPHVQSAARQATVHAARGWLTDELVLEQEGPTVLAFFSAQLEQILGG